MGENDFYFFNNCASPVRNTASPHETCYKPSLLFYHKNTGEGYTATAESYNTNDDSCSRVGPAAGN